MKKKAKREKTPRGFDVYTKLVDTYGSEVRVQKSSSADLAAVWIFCHNKTDKEMAPHLSPSQARQIAAALNEFADENEGEE